MTNDVNAYDVVAAVYTIGIYNIYIKKKKIRGFKSVM